jgi:hypothetical protein
MAVNNDLYLGVGNVSLEKVLGAYYQDLKPAIFHFDNNYLGDFDDNGIPFLIDGERRYYNVVYVTQYALIQHDLYLANTEEKERLDIIRNCINWLESKKEPFKDSIVWRSEKNVQYGLEDGWISAMYQGQAISLYLRAFQLFGDESYLETANKVLLFFKYDYSEGGASRTDENGYLWLEEYPTDPPSYVLNGFIYAMFGALDHFRVTQDVYAEELYKNCLNTLQGNLHKYHRWYWSVYDQKKEQLVSYYYQKNVHIPLMKIMFLLTEEPIFEKYDRKWSRQLNSSFNRLIVQIMYRLQPRIKKIFK